MNRSKAVGLAALMLACAVAGESQSSDTRIVAEVSGRQILVADLMARLDADRRRDLAEKRLDSFASGARERVLDKLVESALLAAGARDQSIDQRPEVQRQIAALVDEFLAQRLVAEITTTAALGDETLRDYYKTHPQEFQQPGRVRARHIVVKTEPEAVALNGRLKRNADFAELARANNIDSSKSAGGELGWVSRGVMVESFEKVLFGLRVGEIGSIVRTPYGFHIVQAEEIEAPTLKPFEAVSSEIRARLIQQRIDGVKAELAKKHPVRIRTDVLKALK